MLKEARWIECAYLSCSAGLLRWHACSAIKENINKQTISVLAPDRIKLK